MQNKRSSYTFNTWILRKTNYLTSSIFKAKVGEPPDVAKTDTVRNAWKGKVPFATPWSPLISCSLFVLDFLQVSWLIFINSLDFFHVLRFARSHVSRNFPDKSCERLHGKNHYDRCGEDPRSPRVGSRATG